MPRIIQSNEAAATRNFIRILQAFRQYRWRVLLIVVMILVMNAGRIVERGTHAELLERGGLYAQLYDEQVKLRSMRD